MYRVYAVTEDGDPVQLPVEVCWRCGGPVLTSMVSMAEHVDRMHPVAAAPRHALVDDPTP